ERADDAVEDQLEARLHGELGRDLDGGAQRAVGDGGDVWVEAAAALQDGRPLLVPVLGADLDGAGGRVAGFERALGRGVEREPARELELDVADDGDESDLDVEGAGEGEEGWHRIDDVEAGLGLDLEGELGGEGALRDAAELLEREALEVRLDLEVGLELEPARLDLEGLEAVRAFLAPHARADGQDLADV